MAKIKNYLVQAYAVLIRTDPPRKTIEEIPEEYQVPVAEYLISLEEEK